MALLICQTCPRYEPGTGSFGRQLDQALAAAMAAGASPRVRHVQCVGGCPTPGNIALDSLGKARVRISQVDTADAVDLIAAEAAYHASPTGNPADWQVPPSLEGRISAVSLKRNPNDEPARPSRFNTRPAG